ncbi:hypothetical protein EJ02DRAFT_340484, partial [Clathrospora elynae]
AISEADCSRIHNFYTALHKVELEDCGVCSRRWFSLNVISGACDDCRKDRRKNSTAPDYVLLYGRENNVDPGIMPPYLPALTPTEEMLIAKVHVFMEIRQHRGQQYKYFGHICHFAVNIGRVFNALPRLPEDLDIIIVKPPASGNDDPNAITRQF